MLVIIAPVAFGALCGYLLGTSEAAYLVASVLSVAGGLLAGFEHPGARDGAVRGVIGGCLFGGSILIAHEIHGHPATATLPDPGILLLALTTFFGALLGALGGRARQRAESGAAAT